MRRAGLPTTSACAGDVAGHDGAGADHRVRADVAAGDHDGAGADRRAVADGDRADRQSVGTGEIAVGVEGPRVAVVGQDRARSDEDAVSRSSRRGR